VSTVSERARDMGKRELFKYKLVLIANVEMWGIPQISLNFVHY